MEYAEAKSVKSDLKACQTLAKRARERERGGEKEGKSEVDRERDTGTAHARS